MSWPGGSDTALTSRVVLFRFSCTERGTGENQHSQQGGHATSVWTLDLAAEVSSAKGLTPRLVTGEAIRQTLLRLGISWKRAKHWITSPDPAYARKKVTATA